MKFKHIRRYGLGLNLYMGDKNCILETENETVFSIQMPDNNI